MNKIILPLIAGMMGLLLTGCGPSKAEIQSMLDKAQADSQAKMDAALAKAATAGSTATDSGSTGAGATVPVVTPTNDQIITSSVENAKKLEALKGEPDTEEAPVVNSGDSSGVHFKGQASTGSGDASRTVSSVSSGSSGAGAAR